MNAPVSVDAPKLAIRRTFDAPPRVVFEAFTQGEALSQWFSPYDNRAEAEVDLRVGGKWAIAMNLPSGERAQVSGEYLEIVPDKRLAFSWAWAGTPDRVSHVAIDLADHGGRTQLTLTHTQFFDVAARDGHKKGWEGCLAGLTKYLGG